MALVQVIELAVINAPRSATAVSKSTVPKHRSTVAQICQAATGSPRSVAGEIRSGCWLKLPPAIIPHATPHSYGAVMRDLTKSSANSEEAVLDQITPVILTYNEENNIARTLDRLRWARDVVVVDSFSTDKTVSLIRAFQVFGFFSVLSTAMLGSGIMQLRIPVSTEWILALDADYYLTNEFIREEYLQLTPLRRNCRLYCRVPLLHFWTSTQGLTLSAGYRPISESERTLRARRTYAACCNGVGQGVGLSNLA